MIDFAIDLAILKKLNEGIDLTKYPDPSPIFVFPVLWIGMILLFKQWLVECVGVKKNLSLAN